MIKTQNMERRWYLAMRAEVNKHLKYVVEKTKSQDCGPYPCRHIGLHALSPCFCGHCKRNMSQLL